VAQARREAMEAKLRAAYPQSRGFTERDASGAMRRAGSRQDYFPVFYLDPVKGNEAALGFDLGSNLARLSAIDTARDTGRPQATAPLALVQETRSQAGFLIFVPVYALGLPLGTVEQRRAAFEGVVVGVFRAGDLLTAAMGALGTKGLRIEFQDRAAPYKAGPIHVWGEPAPGEARSPSLLDRLLLAERPACELELAFAGRTWVARSEPNVSYIEANLPESSWPIIPVGLVLTTLLATLLHLIYTQKQRAEALVEARSLALVDSLNQLHLREEDLRLLLDSAAEAIYGLDLNGDCTFCNQALLDLLGYPNAEAVIGKNMHALIHHTRQDGFPFPVEACRIFQAFQKGQGTHVDDEVLWRADGTSFPAEYWSFPQRREGRVVGSVVTFVDITERRRSEAELLRQQALIRGLLDSIPDIIFFKDQGGVYLGCNPAFAGFVGRTRDEIVGRTDYDLFARDTAEFFREQDQLMYQQLQPRHNEEWITYPGGEARLVDTLKTPYYGSGGELIGILGVSRDITARKEAEDLLRMERKRLADILEGTNVGTWEWNVHTGATVFNERWAGMLGYTLAELAPVSIDTWTRFTHPDDLRRVEDLLGQHFSGELPYYEVEVRMLHRDGHWIWVLDRGKVSSWTEAGKPLLMSGTHQDITARKHAEAELHQQSLLQQVLMEVSSTYINLPLEAVESTIRTSLGHLAEFVGADRAYVFDYDFERRVCSNTHEWCAEGIAPQIDVLQDVPLDPLVHAFQRHPLRLDLGQDDVHGGLEDVLDEGHLRGVEAQVAPLDPGQVHVFPDQPQQIVSLGDELLQLLDLPLVEGAQVALRHDPGIRDHGGDGVLQLVAHERKQLHVSLVGGGQLLAPALQRLDHHGELVQGGPEHEQELQRQDPEAHGQDPPLQCLEDLEVRPGLGVQLEGDPVHHRQEPRLLGQHDRGSMAEGLGVQLRRAVQRAQRVHHGSEGFLRLLEQLLDGARKGAGRKPQLRGPMLDACMRQDQLLEGLPQLLAPVLDPGALRLPFQGQDDLGQALAEHALTARQVDDAGIPGCPFDGIPHHERGGQDRDRDHRERGAVDHHEPDETSLGHGRGHLSPPGGNVPSAFKDRHRRDWRGS
ncbi:MAG TPA: PAS domain S-box protein, partial [Holophaga sp.]|nr:PAS domain S-box protein [Holophaga sp.]